MSLKISLDLETKNSNNANFNPEILDKRNRNRSKINLIHFFVLEETFSLFTARGVYLPKSQMETRRDDVIVARFDRHRHEILVIFELHPLIRV